MYLNNIYTIHRLAQKEVNDEEREGKVLRVGF